MRTKKRVSTAIPEIQEVLPTKDLKSGDAPKARRHALEVAALVAMASALLVCSSAHGGSVVTPTFWRTDFHTDPTAASTDLNGDSDTNGADFIIRTGNHFGTESNGQAAITTNFDATAGITRNVWYHAPGTTDDIGGGGTTLDTVPNGNTAGYGAAPSIIQPFSSRLVTQVTSAGGATQSQANAGTQVGLLDWTYFNTTSAQQTAYPIVISNYGTGVQMTIINGATGTTQTSSYLNLAGSSIGGDYLRIDQYLGNPTGTGLNNSQILYAVYDDSRNDEYLGSVYFTYTANNFTANPTHATATLIPNYNGANVNNAGFYVSYFDVNLDTYTWNSTTSGNWSSTAATAWNSAAYNSGHTLPTNTQGTVVLTQPLGGTAANIAIDVANATVGTLVMDNSTAGGTGGWTLSSSNGTNALTFDNRATAAVGSETSGNALLTIGLTSGATGQVNTISAPVVLLSNLNINVLPGATAAISGAISGTGTGITLANGGTLTLTGASTYNGGTTINSGTISAGLFLASVTATPLGNLQSATNTLTINNGGTLVFTSTGTTGTSLPGTLSTYPTTPFIVNQGGTLQSTTGINNFLGPLTLNGGTVTGVGGFSTSGGYAMFQLSPTVTVGGTSASTITTSGTVNTFNGYNLPPGGTTFTVASTGVVGPDLTVSAELENEGGSNGATAVGLTKTGAGTMALTAANTYSGVTTISAGTLLLSSSTTNNIANSIQVTVGDTSGHSSAILDASGISNAGGFVIPVGQTLAGFGTVKAPTAGMTSNGTIAPGNAAAGLLTITNGPVTLANPSSLAFFLNTPGSGPANGDSLLAVPNLTINPTVTVNVTPGGGFGIGTYYLIDSTAAIVDNSSGFSGWILSGAGAAQYSFKLGTDPNNGSEPSVELVVSAVPEPASLGLLGLGAIGLLARRRRV